MLSPIFKDYNVIIQYRTVRRHQPKSLHFIMENSIEERIEITLRSIERNKNRKQRREKAEKKLAMLIHLRDVVIPRQEAEKQAEREKKEQNLDEEKRKKREYYHIQNQKKYWKTHTPIYRTNGMEREAREEDLYTLEELFNPPEEETGRINIEVWNRLVNEYRSKLQNESRNKEQEIHNP